MISLFRSNKGNIYKYGVQGNCMVIKIEDLLKNIKSREITKAKKLEPKIDLMLKQKQRSLFEGNYVNFEIGDNLLQSIRIGEYLKKKYQNTNEELNISLMREDTILLKFQIHGNYLDQIKL